MPSFVLLNQNTTVPLRNCSVPNIHCIYTVYKTFCAIKSRSEPRQIRPVNDCVYFTFYKFRNNGTLLAMCTVCYSEFLKMTEVNLTQNFRCHP